MGTAARIKAAHAASVVRSFGIFMETSTVTISVPVLHNQSKSGCRVMACSTAFRAPHELGDALCQLQPKTGCQIVSHPLHQHEFRARNGFGRRSPAAHVA